jgi:tripartite-type tricarboxylate transporter receptor subunit TctC
MTIISSSVGRTVYPSRRDALLTGVSVALVPTAFAQSTPVQDFPARSIRIVVPVPPGGGTDILARLIAEKLQARWGQSVIVENRGGSGGNIGAEAVSRAAPDGYTVLLVAQGALVINKALNARLNYDPEALVPVSLVASTPAVLLVNPKVAADSVQQLIALAKANPGKLNYATQGVGTSAHLTAELFKSMGGISIVHVPYKGTSLAMVDLISGEVSMMFGELATAGPHIRSGKLRVLAVASERRTSLVPNMPAVAEVLPGFVSMTWWGMVAPAGTPASIANRLSGGVAEALKHPDVAKRLADLSIEGIGSTPTEFAAYMKQERDLWGKVIKLSGATAE